MNELAVRLPALLLSLGVLWLAWDLAKKHSGHSVALLSMLVLAGSMDFFLDAGTVMTDPALVFCVTLVLVSFWHAVIDGNKIWSYVFFVGLGLGLLAKGPVAPVLAGMPIFCWVLWRKEWRNLWCRLPWVKGFLMMLAIALPWYIWAEVRTPGFLNYFILGENFHRFITPGWTGDKYGFAHQEPWGMIWIFAVIGIFPWCLLGAIWFVIYRKKLPALFSDEDGWLGYLFLCTVVPLFFFTFSRNIIYTYIFPSLPFFALFFTEYWDRAGALLSSKKLIVGLSLVMGVVFFAVTIIFYVMPNLLSKTQKPVIIAWLKQDPAPGSKLVYWDYKTEFSAQFYSAGRVAFALKKEDLCRLLSNKLENYVVVQAQLMQTLPPDLLAKMTEVQRVIANNKSEILLRTPVFSC